MKKVVLNKLKKVIIIYLITYIALTSMTSSLARGYDAQCGEYAGQWAIDFIEKYASNSSYTQSNLGNINGNSACKWSGGADSSGYGTGTFYGCCTCWVHWIFYYALGVDINDMGFSPSSGTAYGNLRGGNEYFDDVTGQTLQAGDILIVDGHAEMYAGDDKHANFGGTPMNVHSACNRMTPGRSSEGAIAVRLKSSVQVNPAGTVAVEELEDEDLSIYDDNGFIYKGVASIEAYESSVPLGKWIINMLSEILDYLIGILTFGIRVVIVGWTAIIERVFIDGIVNAITGVTNKKDETWVPDPTTVDDIDEQAAADEEAEAAEQPAIEDVGDESNPNEYISSGMQQVSKIGGNVQLKTSSKANVTIENIVYNKIPILDINFFNFESAGGAVVDEDGVIYIIKENVAMWYYIFRIMAILIMLLVLIYLGIKMAITTVSEKKAVYKEMLLSWVAGFILVFAVSYIMYAIIHVNEAFISWIIPEYEDGTELSLYETVRTKAYSLKATTGFTGMIMYIVLVYYSIRFLIVYFKRFLTVTILALMSPFISVAYAIEKVNKNGKGGEIYGNWFKDFLYSVIIQAIHALIYTLFISIILKLTEASLLGILISFIFLHFMVRIDKVVRKIFGLEGKNAGKIALGDIKSGSEMAKAINKNVGGVKKIGGKYGNYLGKTVGRPFGAAIGKAGDAIDNIKDKIRFGEEEIEIDPEEQKKRKQEKEARKENRKETLQNAAIGARAGLNLAKSAALKALVVPAMIAEPKMSVEILNAAISSKERAEALLKEFEDKINKNTKATTAAPGQRFKLKGIQPRSQKALSRIMSRLSALGVGYKLASGVNINDGNPPQERTRLRDLTEEQRRELSSKLGTNNLNLLNSSKTIEEVLEETGDITRTEEYADLLAQAHALEKELESSYRQITGKIDDEIAEAEKTVGREFAIRLQAKKAKELKTTAKVMSQPLSEKDIYRAMQNYKSKVPQFNPTAALSQADMTGITKEINSILESKGQSIIMTKEFALKVKKELTESQRKASEEEARRKNNHNVGQDMTSQNAASRVNVQEVNEMGSDGKSKRLKDRLKEENAPDMYNPNSESNVNAPKQNVPGSEKETEEGATERLVKNIQNASKGTEGKTTSAFTPRHIEFTKKLDELRKLGERMADITGGTNEFDLDDIFRRLEEL